MLNMGALSHIAQDASNFPISSRRYEATMAAASTLLSRASNTARDAAVSKCPDVMEMLCENIEKHMATRKQVRRQQCCCCCVR